MSQTSKFAKDVRTTATKEIEERKEREEGGGCVCDSTIAGRDLERTKERSVRFFQLSSSLPLRFLLSAIICVLSRPEFHAIFTFFDPAARNWNKTLKKALLSEFLTVPFITAVRRGVWSRGFHTAKTQRCDSALLHCFLCWMFVCLLFFRFFPTNDGNLSSVSCGNVLGCILGSGRILSRIAGEQSTNIHHRHSATQCYRSFFVHHHLSHRLTGHESFALNLQSAASFFSCSILLFSSLPLAFLIYPLFVSPSAWLVAFSAFAFRSSGHLHLGHALTCSIEDAIVRWSVSLSHSFCFSWFLLAFRLVFSRRPFYLLPPSPKSSSSLFSFLSFRVCVLIVCRQTERKRERA